MNTFCLVFCVLLLFAVPAFAAPPDFVVAPDGRDEASGTPAAPFATVARAQVAARERHRQTSKSVVVQIRPGTYFLAAPLVFTADDADTTYQAAPGKPVVLSGGTRIDRWKTEGGRWTANLPRVRSGAWNFAQLFVGEQRRTRPRLPRTGYFFAASDVPAVGDGFETLAFAPGAVKASWVNLSDVEILGFQVWTMARMRLRSVDEAANTAKFTAPIPGKESYRAVGRGKRFLVENIKEALSEPGEFYLDRPTGDLTYLPKPGETPDKTEVIAPRLETLVEFNGPQNVTFRGLTFAHANWVTPPGGSADVQAEIGIGAAISGTNAHNVTLEKCTVTHVGGHAVRWGAGCKNNKTTNCTMTDLGGGGVYVGTTDLKSEAEAASGNVVENCLIAHGGRLHPAAIGVWIGHSDHNRISRNEIRDFYYTGVSVGWSWGYGPSGAHHNEILDNRISQIGQGVLSDMGGIYTLGLSPGTILRGNFVHDISSFSYGGWGIYPDEGSTGELIENNLTYRTNDAGFHQHYGKENVVRNNIFALAQQALVRRTRAEDHLSFTFERNIVLSDDVPILGSNWTGDGFKIDGNLYWNRGKQLVLFDGKTLSEWQKAGHDVHSLVADPLFIAPNKGDFRLRPDSPASKIGFVPFDAPKAGRVGAKPDTSFAPRAFPEPPPPPEPTPIADDFESSAVGSKALTASTQEENETATVRVTGEAAASGKHSLKFTDAPGQKFNFNPHLYYEPGFTKGRLRVAFDLRWEPGAMVYHEWRDKASPYKVGPSLTVSAAGALVVAGKTLARLLPSSWTRFEIVSTLGSGNWTLTVTPSGASAPLRFADLSCDPHWAALDWCGFVSLAETGSVFYLDNVAIGPAGRG